MSRAALAIMLLAGLAGATENTPVEGVWTANLTGDGRLRLTLDRSSGRSVWRSTSEYPLETFRGLAPGTLNGSRQQVSISLDRDAGSVVLEGTFGAGRGAGTFTFSPSKSFISELRKLGAGGISDERMFEMTVQDIGIDFVREAAAALPRFDVEDLIRLRNHGVNASYLREVRLAGYRGLTASDHARLRSHGVSSEYLVELKKMEYDLRCDDIVKLRSHGVDTGYLGALRTAGMRLTADEIVRLRSHGVRPEFLSAVRDAGLGFGVEPLVRLHDNGVRGDYLRGLAETGHGSLSPDEMIRLRNHGVGIEYLRQLRAVRYRNFSTDEIIRLRQNGVDGAYVQRIASAGLKDLTPDQIIRLRQHGVD